MSGPMFYARPQAGQAEVAWVPATTGAERVLVTWLDSTIPVTVAHGLALEPGDLVSLTRIGQTYRVDALISKRPVEPPPPPETEEPDQPDPV